MAQPQLSDADVARIANQMSANQAFINAIRTAIALNPPPVPPGQQIDTRCRIEDFGYFQPDLPVDDRNPSGDVVTVGKDTFYRDVDAFCERIKDAIATRDPVQVRDNLHLCLRSSAQRWWVHELATIDKSSIRHDVTPQLEQWMTRLQNRFRLRLSQALRENSALTFTMADVRAGNRVRSYFQTKLLRASACGFESVHAKLTQVHAGIDPLLRQHLSEPTESTTIDFYRELLEEKESLWIDLYNARLSAGRIQPQLQQRQRSQSPNRLRPQQQQQLQAASPRQGQCCQLRIF